MKSWGFSGRVGEWDASVPGGAGDDIEARFARVAEIVDGLAPELDSLHQLHRARVDLSILNSELEEEEFQEDVELNITDFSHIVPAFRELAQTYPRCLITRVDLDLHTWVVEKSQYVLVPKSAELYIGTELDVLSGQEVDIDLSYSTFIDVWLSKTLGSEGQWRNNRELAERNHPHLQRFLQALAEKLGRCLQAGESVYYLDPLRENGFKKICPKKSGQLDPLPSIEHMQNLAERIPVPAL